MVQRQTVLRNSDRKSNNRCIRIRSKFPSVFSLILAVVLRKLTASCECILLELFSKYCEKVYANTIRICVNFCTKGRGFLGVQVKRNASGVMALYLNGEEKCVLAENVANGQEGLQLTVNCLGPSQYGESFKITPMTAKKY